MKVKFPVEIIMDTLYNETDHLFCHNIAARIIEDLEDHGWFIELVRVKNPSVNHSPNE